MTSTSLSFDDKWNQLAKNDQQTSQESTEEVVGRNIGQNVARASETVLGYPGNLKKALAQSFEMMPELMGIKFPGKEQLKEAEEEIGYKPRQPIPGSLEETLRNPPTPQDIREKQTPLFAKEIGGEEKYFEPKSEMEKKTGELTQDITSFFLPGTRQLRMSTRIGVPILGKLGEEGLKYVGVDEKKAESAKVGFNMMMTIANQSNPGQFASERIGNSKQMIPDTATVDVLPLANRLMPLYNRMTRGLQTPSKARTTQGMRELAEQVQNGRMNFRSLMDARDNINEWIAEAHGFDVPRPTRDAAIRNLEDLKRQVIDTINENMERRFPEAYEQYRTGYEAAAVNHQSNVISNFIERYFGRKIASAGAKVLFPGLASGAAAAGMPKVAAGAAIAAPIYQTGKVLYRVANSPTLAQYYQDVLHASSLGNAPLMINSMSKLDKALAEEEKKDQKKNGITFEDFKAGFKKKD